MSRRLYGWWFTLENAAGDVVAQQFHGAWDGGARPTWNGKLSDGSPAPAGTYSWTLTIAAWGGGVDSTATPATGQVTVISGDTYQPLAQARVFSSGSAPLVAGVDRDVQVSGLGGVPVGADAVLVNVEVQNPSSAGYVRVTPGGTSSSTAVQQFVKGQTISNLVAVKLSASGKIRLHVSAGSATVFADVAGYYKH
jgi:hypothetical protein